jgi:hypothetical protein
MLHSAALKRSELGDYRFDVCWASQTLTFDDWVTAAEMSKHLAAVANSGDVYAVLSRDA